MALGFHKNLGNMDFRCIRCGNIVMGYTEETIKHIDTMITKVNNFLTRFFWVALLAVAYAVIQLSIWLFDREIPFIYRNGAVTEVLKERTVSLQYSAVRRRSCDVTITRYLDSPSGRAYLPRLFLSKEQINKLARESPGKVSVILEIPEGVPLNNLFYSVELSYECNPIHSFWPILVRFSVPIILESK